MFGDIPVVPAHSPTIAVDASLPPQSEALRSAELTAPAPTPEQIRAAEAVFANQEEESRQVAGLLGMWTGALLLHDVAVEQFDGTADEQTPRLHTSDDEDGEE